MAKKTVYICFGADFIHKGHLNIIEKASKLGSITAGIMSDEVVASIDRYPLLPEAERAAVIGALKHIDNVVVQDSVFYDKVIDQIKPDYVVHGDNWKTNHQSYIREALIKKLDDCGGELVEFPYTYSEQAQSIEKAAGALLSVSEMRRPRLKRLLATKKLLSVIEAHSGLSGLIVENTVVEHGGKRNQFDGMWISSLCDSTVKGKPDIELVDMTSRLKTIDEIMEVTTKFIILDGDSGGLTEHFEYNIKTLERIGVSAVIIEDKIGLKRNSLFGDVGQGQDTIENFCAKISAGKRALRTKDFMLIARVESLILGNGMEDALKRAFAYIEAGADGIMIHSRQKSPDEIMEFAKRFRAVDNHTPLVIVPTTYNTVTESEWAERGINIVIYANHFIRSAFPAMQKTAETILRDRKAENADKLCLSIKEILELIPNN